MIDLYNSGDLKFIYKYMKANKDLAERLKKELNISDSHILINRSIESCVKEYEEDNCTSMSNFMLKHKTSYNWILKNNKLDEFKNLTGVENVRTREAKI